MSEKEEGRSQVSAQIVGDGVMILPSNESGSILRFDRKPTKVCIILWMAIVMINIPHTDSEERNSYSRKRSWKTYRLPSKDSNNSCPEFSA